MINHPSRHYIHYLLSRQDLTASEILRKLDSVNLPLPAREADVKDLIVQIKRAQEEMRVPAGFSPRDPEHVLTNLFLRKWGIKDFWRRTEAVKAAGSLLRGDLTARRSLELMLLGPISVADISIRLNSYYRIPKEKCSVPVIQAYSHYFWNIGAMTRSRWMRLVGDWAGDEDRHAYITAIKAPRSEAGISLVLSLADRDTADNFDPIKQYQMVRDVSYSNFMEISMAAYSGRSMSPLIRSQAALLHLQAMKMADEELKERRGANASEFMKTVERLERAHLTKKPLPAGELFRQLPAGAAPGDVIDATAVSETEEQETRQ